MMSRATMVTTVIRTTQPASRQTIRLMIFGLQTGPGPQQSSATTFSHSTLPSTVRKTDRRSRSGPLAPSFRLQMLKTGNFTH